MTLLRIPRSATLLLVPLCAFASATIAAELRAQSADSVPAAPAPADPHAVQPERPTVATHAYTIAPGYVEIEVGVQDARPHNATQFIAPLVVKLGVVPRTQLELQTGYVRNSALGATTSGATDIALALKQRLLDGAPILRDFSVQASVKFATGAHDVGTGTTDVSLLLISSRQLGPAELDLNAGYTRRSGDGSIVPTSATLVTASMGSPIRGPVGGVAELFAYPGTGGPAGNATAVGFIFGPTLQVRPWLVLDAGAILNVRNMGSNAAFAGITYNVGRIPGFPSIRPGA